jgi:hypothetical protein
MKANEILFYAAIGGTVGAGLAAFELVVRKWLTDSPETGVSWNRLVALIGVFLFVFIGIPCLEIVLNWIPTPIQNVGYLSGRWIDAIKDDAAEVIGGSAIEISSARGRGFELH